MDLADYNVVFIHIRGKNNIFADATSRLKTLDIYKEALKNPQTPVVTNPHGHVMGEIHATDMHTISTTMLFTEQKWDIMCKKTSITIMLQ